MNIVFYNYFHNGDIFTSREYVKQVVRCLPHVLITYQHNNSPKLLKDFCAWEPITEHLPVDVRYFIKDGTVFINTWIAAYSSAKNPEPPHYYDVGIDYISLTKMWNHIFEYINSLFDTDLKIKDPIDYVPSIDYTKFDVSKVDAFVTEHKNIVMISNGPPMSGQSFDNDMSVEINTFAKIYPDISFVCTHPIVERNYSNIYNSGRITQERQDLMELSYLSRFAKVIIGKNSGPYIYACVKGNVMAEDKVFLQFNRYERDSLFYGIPHRCSYTFVPPPLWTNTNTFISVAMRKAFNNE